MQNMENPAEKPLVSVIIPTYKRSDTLPRALESVLRSTWKSVEIIVVDDNNNGDEFRKKTEALMSGYVTKYQNIIYLKHEVNKNGSAARNTGIRKASGKYIMFLDDDDEILPLKIEKQVEYLESHDESWGACYTSYSDYKNGKFFSGSAETSEGNLLINELARNLFVHAGSNLMVRHEVVTDLNGFDESFQRNQDVEFLIRLLKKYKLGYANVDGLIVHMHIGKMKLPFYTNTEHYLSRFREDIDALEERDREAVYRMIGLQLIRYAIVKRNFGRISGFKKEYKVSNAEIIRYMNFLALRVIKHKSCSYPMKHLYRKGK